MQTQNSKIDTYRYERKFIIFGLSKQAVESIIKLHPAMFSEIFYKRYVNNIYFDSIDFRNYLDNIEGSTHRMKLRIRWYGELFGSIAKPVLEIKSKNSNLGKKDSFKLNPFKLEKGFNVASIANILDNSEISKILKMKINFFKPVILNRYSRKYFQSVDKNYRITIDNDMVFYQISHHDNSFLNKIKKDNAVILELKYDEAMDDVANHISNSFPFRLTKSSKYVTGIDALYMS